MNRDEELDGIVDDRERAGLIETYVQEDGRTAYRLTAEGARLGRLLAMGDDADGQAVLDALLDARRS